MKTKKSFNNLGIWWEDFRFRLLRFIGNNIAKIEPTMYPPKWLRVVHFILFPLHGMYERQAQIYYDIVRDSYTIRGVKISGSFISLLRDTASIGTVFKLVRNDDGIVTFEIVREERLGI